MSFQKVVRSGTQSKVQQSGKEVPFQTGDEPQHSEKGGPKDTVQEAAHGSPKQKARPLSKAQRRKLAEAEEINFQKQKERERMLKNVKQGGWIALTAALVVLLSVGLIRLM